MKRFLLSVVFLLSVSAIYSQKLHFVYLQSDKQQPFFAKINNKTYSSSQTGYLIIPRLVDSTYEVVVGFAKNEFPEQSFVVNINQKDHGFLLKNFGNEGWGLYDLVTSQIQKAGTMQVEAIAKQVPVIEQTLSGTVREEVKEVVVVTNPVIETKKVEEKQPEKKAPEIVSHAPQKIDDAKSVITRKTGKEAAEGVNVVFIDENETGIDTINIVIPNEKKVELINTEKDKKFLDFANEGKVTKEQLKEEKPIVKVETEKPIVVEEKKQTSTSIKNECKSIATETEFVKLRRAMAAKADDDNMVDEARKAFKSKCFTTQQIRSLSVLFIDDLGKYKFFDAAFLFTSDKENFSILEKELEKEYYINRFKAMLQ